MKKIFMTFIFVLLFATHIKAQSDRDVFNKLVGGWQSSITNTIGGVTVETITVVNFEWGKWNKNHLMINFTYYSDLGIRNGDIGYLMIDSTDSFVYATWLDEWGIVEAKWGEPENEFGITDNKIIFSNDKQIREIELSENNLTITAFTKNGKYLGKFSYKKFW
ncbi:MAG TPA: hypothetical protein VHP32_01965 [Ignavibacteria bacterium]|nr:hypothetical protein [Ignavibacteria bacterium]